MSKSLIRNVLLEVSVFAFLTNYSSHLSTIVFGHLCCRPGLKMLQLRVAFVVNSSTLPLPLFVLFIIYSGLFSESPSILCAASALKWVQNMRIGSSKSLK